MLLPGADTIRVAIVEDDVLLRDGLSRMVQEAEGLCCRAAYSSVEEAFESLKDCPPDVLLLDIGLPGMAGSDAVRAFPPDISGHGYPHAHGVLGPFQGIRLHL